MQEFGGKASVEEKTFVGPEPPTFSPFPSVGLSMFKEFRSTFSAPDATGFSNACINGFSMLIIGFWNHGFPADTFLNTTT